VLHSGSQQLLKCNVAVEKGRLECEISPRRGFILCLYRAVAKRHVVPALSNIIVCDTTSVRHPSLDCDVVLGL
jgi:hypothetical protein